LAPYREFAIRVAQAAGVILMRYHRQTQRRTYKSATDFKTAADDLSDALIRQRIAESFPDHRIFSEEYAEKAGAAPWVWVVDPLDGTYNFASLWSNDFSVSIGLAYGVEPVVGVVYVPAQHVIYAAAKGGGAFRNGQPVRVGAVSEIRRAFVATDYGKGERRRDLIPYLQRLLSPDGVNYPVTFACASLSLARVAVGQLDAYLSVNLEPWDMAAGVAIIRAAGGTVTTIEGKEWALGDPTILAANSRLHGKLLKFLRLR